MNFGWLLPRNVLSAAVIWRVFVHIDVTRVAGTVVHQVRRGVELSLISENTIILISEIGRNGLAHGGNEGVVRIRRPCVNRAGVGPEREHFVRLKEMLEVRRPFECSTVLRVRTRYSIPLFCTFPMFWSWVSGDTVASCS